MEQDDRKLFVLDTNVLLHEPLAIYSFKEHDVVIPMTVLEELDQIKDRKSDVSRDARVAIRALEDTLGGETTPEQIINGVPLPSREGHADAVGSDAYNRQLSAARAFAVKNALAALGVSGDQVATEGLGTLRPLFSRLVSWASRSSISLANAAAAPARPIPAAPS